MGRTNPSAVERVRLVRWWANGGVWARAPACTRFALSERYPGRHCSIQDVTSIP
jgi:hypothetical protein